MDNTLSTVKPFEVDKDRAKANSPKDHIPGWGIDADPEDKPNYPMKHYNGADYERLNYERPPQQPESVEVLKSIERPTITRVFGASTPPSGLSGQIRRFAFKYSESTYAHWVPLVLADRINVVEGIVSDLKKGIVPNLFVEKGWNAEWKYNRQGFIKNVVVTAVVAYVAIKLLSGSNKQSRHA
jgi:hypothetical protein